MTDTLATLDEDAANLVRRYRDAGKVAAVARTNDGHVSIVTLATKDAAIAKLLYAAADTFADRAFYAEKGIPDGSSERD